jgi:shikimate kinase
MGTGKTTVGQLVAQMSGRPFVDMDDLIVQHAGLSIPEIFQSQGEAAFRELETAFCRDLAGQSGLVVATGGGALVNEENRRILAETGLVICLTAAPDAIRERLAGNDGRPLAKQWETLLEKRWAAYAAMPHQVDTTGKTPEQVAEEIVALWRSEST